MVIPEGVLAWVNGIVGAVVAASAGWAVIWPKVQGQRKYIRSLEMRMKKLESDIELSRGETALQRAEAQRMRDLRKSDPVTIAALREKVIAQDSVIKDLRSEIKKMVRGLPDEVRKFVDTNWMPGFEKPEDDDAN